MSSLLGMLSFQGLWRHWISWWTTQGCLAVPVTLSTLILWHGTRTFFCPQFQIFYRMLEIILHCGLCGWFSVSRWNNCPVAQLLELTFKCSSASHSRPAALPAESWHTQYEHPSLQGHIQVSRSWGSLFTSGMRICMHHQQQQLVSLSLDLKNASSKQKWCHFQLVRLNLFYYAVNSDFFCIIHRDFQDELRLACAMRMRQAVEGKQGRNPSL